MAEENKNNHFLRAVALRQRLDLGKYSTASLLHYRAILNKRLAFQERDEDKLSPDLRKLLRSTLYAVNMEMRSRRVQALSPQYKAQDEYDQEGSERTQERLEGAKKRPR